MNRFSLALLALATALAISPMAKADTLYAFSFTSLDGLYTATGTVTAGWNQADNAILATAGNITISTNPSGGPEDGLTGTLESVNPGEQTSPGGGFDVDNYLYEGNPFLDQWGLLFDSGSPAVEINFWGNGPDNYSLYVDDNGNYTVAETGNLTIVPEVLTPEPTSLLLFGAGLLGLAGLLRRKFMFSR